MKFLKLRLAILLILTLTISCSKSDNVDNAKPIDLTQARMNDFMLTEAAYSDIDISHPQLHNGAEVGRGTIHLKIPKGNTQLNLTPAISNFSNSAFTILPELGTTQNFLNKTVTYTISSKINPAIKVHYDVTIEEIPDPVEIETEITGFRFEMAKNPGLNADITAAKIIEGVATIGKIIVMVPVGTDFSKLTPSIEFSGGELYYSQDPASAPANVTTKYPATGIKVDFKYPKVFYAIVKKDSDVKTYEVIVDVRNPIKFQQTTVIAPNAVRGAIRSSEITSFTNQGNHAISLSAIEHKDHLPAGTNAVRGSSAVPSMGLKPGETAIVRATVSAQTYPVGLYSVSSVFKAKLINEPDADDLMEETALNISVNIVDQ